MHLSDRITRLLVLAALGTGLAAPAMSEEIKDLATGEGLITVPSRGDAPDEQMQFKPRFGTAFRTDDPPRVWLLLTDREAPVNGWQDADDRAGALTAWCKKEQAPFVLFELDMKGEPQLVTECGGGAVSVEMISTMNGLASVAPNYETFDEGHIRGSIRGGKGSCGEDAYCDVTKNYYFDVTVQQSAATVATTRKR